MWKPTKGTFRFDIMPYTVTSPEHGDGILEGETWWRSQHKGRFRYNIIIDGEAKVYATANKFSKYLELLLESGQTKITINNRFLGGYETSGRYLSKEPFYNHYTLEVKYVEGSYMDHPYYMPVSIKFLLRKDKKLKAAIYKDIDLDKENRND